MRAPYGALKLWFDSSLAREEALAILDAYSTLIECSCGTHRRAGLGCAICGRAPAPEEIGAQEEPAPPQNTVLWPSRSSP